MIKFKLKLNESQQKEFNQIFESGEIFKALEEKIGHKVYVKCEAAIKHELMKLKGGKGEEAGQILCNIWGIVRGEPEYQGV